MSNYLAPAWNPATGKVEVARWLDDHFGRHAYGVQFPGSDHVYHAHEIGLEAAGAEVERLRSDLAIMTGNRDMHARLNERFKKLLAASRASEARLKEALTKAREAFICDDERGAWNIINAALNSPPSHGANARRWDDKLKMYVFPEEPNGPSHGASATTCPKCKRTRVDFDCAEDNCGMAAPSPAPVGREADLRQMAAFVAGAFKPSGIFGEEYEQIIFELLQHAAALTSEPEAGWLPIESAPKDGTEIWIYAPPREGLGAIQCMCAWHPDAGFCVDELRFVTHWRPLPSPPHPALSAQEGGSDA